MEITASGLGDLTISQMWEFLAGKVIREDNLGTVSTFANGEEIRSYHCKVGTTDLSAICTPDRIQLSVTNEDRRLDMTKMEGKISIYIPLDTALFDEAFQYRAQL